MLLMIVQLLSSSVHVVNHWYVKTLEVSVSLHIIDCSTTLTYPWPNSCPGIFSSRKNLCQPALQYPHQGPPLGPDQLVMLMVTTTLVLGVRHALWHDVSCHFHFEMVGWSTFDARRSVLSPPPRHPICDQVPLLPQEAAASHRPRSPFPLTPTGIWWTWKSLSGVLDPVAHSVRLFWGDSCHAIFSVTPSACGQLFFVPLLERESFLLLANSAFPTRSAPDHWSKTPAEPAQATLRGSTLLFWLFGGKNPGRIFFNFKKKFK